MEPQIFPFIWNAEVIVSRGVDDPLFLNAVVSATMTDSVGSYGTLLLEDNAVNWLAEQVDEPVENMTVVSFSWSMLDAVTPPPAPA